MKKLRNVFLTTVMMLAVGAWSAQAQTTRTFAEAGGPTSDGWNNTANWTGSAVPSGTDSAIISDGDYASVWRKDDGTTGLPLTPTYSGGLTIGVGSTLRLGSGGFANLYSNSFNGLGTGDITMKANSTIRMQLRESGFTYPDLILEGDATILSASNEAHNRSYNLGSVTGTGQLTISGTNNNVYRFITANPGWSGGLIITQNSNNRTSVEGDIAGAFGTGDVTSQDWTTLRLDAANTIDDGATLFLNGNRRNNVPSKLILNASETVERFILNGAKLAAGTYTSASGLTDSGGINLISGSGTLTVLIPEPSSFALLALGGISAYFVRRRRR